jgi:predicted outer membrane protein
MDETPRPGPDRGRVIVVGRSPDKMREAIDVLRTAGFTVTGTFDRDQALDAIATHDELFAVVAGGSVDQQLEAELCAAAEPKGAGVVRAFIGHQDPARHFEDHVLPQLEQLAARQQGQERR